MSMKPGFQLRSIAFGAAVIVALVESATGASRAAGELRAQHFGAAGDHGQQVVEVVRGAAGEPADRLDLVRLA